jgi:hypothetical protein
VLSVVPFLSCDRYTYYSVSSGVQTDFKVRPGLQFPAVCTALQTIRRCHNYTCTFRLVLTVTLSPSYTVTTVRSMRLPRFRLIFSSHPTLLSLNFHPSLSHIQCLSLFSVHFLSFSCFPFFLSLFIFFSLSLPHGTKIMQRYRSAPFSSFNNHPHIEHDSMKFITDA